MKTKGWFIPCILILGSIVSCSQRETPAYLESATTTDTLGRTCYRVVYETHDKGKMKELRYYFSTKDSSSYYSLQVWEDYQPYIKGMIKDNKRQGEWKAFYRNGLLWSVQNYDDGEREGSSMVYYENGNIRYKKSYKGDKAHGDWVFYDGAGKKLGQIRYENGEKISEVHY